MSSTRDAACSSSTMQGCCVYRILIPILLYTRTICPALIRRMSVCISFNVYFSVFHCIIVIKKHHHHHHHLFVQRHRYTYSAKLKTSLNTTQQHKHGAMGAGAAPGRQGGKNGGGA